MVLKYSSADITGSNEFLKCFKFLVQTYLSFFSILLSPVHNFWLHVKGEFCTCRHLKMIRTNIKKIYALFNNAELFTYLTKRLNSSFKMMGLMCC